MGERTPDGFEFIHVKVVVFLKQMQQFDVFNDFVLCVGKRAKRLVIAFVNIVRVELAEFSFVPVGMIQLLKFVVGKFTQLVGAFLPFTDEMTVSNVGGSASVFIVVVVKTCFSLVPLMYVCDRMKIYFFCDTFMF